MIRKSEGGKERNKKLGEKLRKYFTARTIILSLLFIFVFLILKNMFKGIILLLAFFPMSLYTVRITRFINYITLETNTASAIIMGYLFGPAVGAISGLMLATYGYLSNSVTKFLAFVDVFLTTMTGFLVGSFFTKMDFGMAFILAVIIKNSIGFIAYFFLDPDKVQNVIYRTTHVFWNIFIVRQLYEVIYAIFTHI